VRFILKNKICIDFIVKFMELENLMKLKNRNRNCYEKNVKSVELPTKVLTTLENYDRVSDSKDPTDIIREKNISDLNANFKVIFKKKNPALTFMNSLNRKDLVLIAEDLTTTGAKKFIVVQTNYLIKKVTNKKYSLYEWIDRTVPVKLYIDIDLNEKLIEKDRDKELDDHIKRINKLVCHELKRHFNISKPRCIVLKSQNETGKASAHLIYPDIVFEDINCIKYMFCDCSYDTGLISDKILDPSVYKSGCFRFLYSNKKGKDNTLEFYKGINYEKPELNKNLFLDCMICNIKENDKILTFEYKDKIKSPIVTKKPKTKNQEVLNQLKEMNSNQKALPNDIKYILDNIKVKRSDDYMDWINVGIAVFNCNNTKEGFTLWDNWSQLSSKYDKECTIYKWNSFVNNNFKAGYHTLLYFLKTDNKEAYKKLNIKDIKSFDTIKVNKQYLFSKTDTDIIAKSIENWMIDDLIKFLAMMSNYGTGKTFAVDCIIDIYKPIKILWITHRQSLTLNLMGTFEEHEFFNYMDKDYNMPRLFISIESLHNLNKKNMNFDLIILDEIESLLYHFCSPTVKNPRETFNIFIELINKSKKVLCLDGDISDRTYKFIKEFGNNFQIIENTYKPFPKKFIFTKDVSDFDLRISNDIYDKKNICIVCMSANMANDYYQKYKDNYKVILHCSKSDDKLKQNLIDVNKFWINYQVVIYSPSVSEGVDFSIVDYIDNMYVVLSQNSCSPRGLMQMIGRIRKPKSNIIRVYLNDVPYYENSITYNINDVEIHLNTMKKICEKEHDIKVNTGLYDTIVKYNELENLNKNGSYFTTVLIRLLEKKGHTYEIEDYKPDPEEDNNKNIGLFAKNSIIEAEDIEDCEFEALLYKQKNNIATEADKLSIEKHCYKLNWGEDNIDMNFMKVAYRKTHILLNLRSIYNGTDNKLITIDSNYIVYADMKSKEKIRIIKDFLNILGYDSLTEEKLIIKDEFQNNMKTCIEKAELFTNTKYTMPLFGMTKKTLDSIKSFLGFINSILNNYGLTITTIQKNTRKNYKNISINYYKLHTIPEFYKYLEIKKPFSENLLDLLQN